MSHPDAVGHSPGQGVSTSEATALGEGRLGPPACEFLLQKSLFRRRVGQHAAYCFILPSILARFFGPARSHASLTDRAAKVSRGQG